MNNQVKMVPRSEDEIQQILKRLNRVEGQIRGISKMVEEDRYCLDILTQVLAAEAALKKVGFSLVERHAKHCVSQAVSEGNSEEALKEVMVAFQRFAK